MRSKQHGVNRTHQFPITLGYLFISQWGQPRSFITHLMPKWESPRILITHLNCGPILFMSRAILFIFTNQSKKSLTKFHDTNWENHENSHDNDYRKYNQEPRYGYVHIVPLHCRPCCFDVCVSYDEESWAEGQYYQRGYQFYYRHNSERRCREFANAHYWAHNAWGGNWLSKSGRVLGILKEFC